MQHGIEVGALLPAAFQSCVRDNELTHTRGDMSRKSIERMRAEFERTSLVLPSYIASLLGVVVGPAIVLGGSVALIIWISHWSSGFGLFLSLFVLIGAVSSAFELVTVARLRAKRSPSEFGWNGVLYASTIDFAFFACALFALYAHFFQVN